MSVYKYILIKKSTNEIVGMRREVDGPYLEVPQGYEPPEDFECVNDPDIDWSQFTPGDVAKFNAASKRVMPDAAATKKRRQKEMHPEIVALYRERTAIQAAIADGVDMADELVAINARIAAQKTEHARRGA